MTNNPLCLTGPMQCTWQAIVLVQCWWYSLLCVSENGRLQATHNSELSSLSSFSAWWHSLEKRCVYISLLLCSEELKNFFVLRTYCNFETIEIRKRLLSEMGFLGFPDWCKKTHTKPVQIIDGHGRRKLKTAVNSQVWSVWTPHLLQDTATGSYWTPFTQWP